MAQMLEHAALANNVAHAFRPYNCGTALELKALPEGADEVQQTVVFPDVFQRELIAVVLALDYAHFAEGAFAHHT